MIAYIQKLIQCGSFLRTYNSSERTTPPQETERWIEIKKKKKKAEFNPNSTLVFWTSLGEFRD
jgi:hypothetical protein